jgi:prolyl oligopeptidase PreP (S9A serine peptidase family)
MGIKKLKQQNNEISISLVDLLGRFDISKTKKYTQFLVKMLHKQYNEEMVYRVSENRISHYTENRGERFEEILNSDKFEDFVTKRVLFDTLFDWDEMSSFVKFCELMERGLIKEKDISKYDSWDMLNQALIEGIYKESFKNSKKEIHTIYDEDGYLVFRPLTYNSSVYYGYQAKWCTAMTNDPSYFYQHSKGVLVYVIDHNKNTKYGFHRPYDSEHFDTGKIFNVFNEKGRSVDTYETGLPVHILNIIMDELAVFSSDFTPNYELFSETEFENMENAIGKTHKTHRIHRGPGPLAILRTATNGATFLEPSEVEFDTEEELLTEEDNNYGESI